jgi:integrase
MLAWGLSASTIVKIHAILSSAYEIGVKRGNVARNPCRLLERPLDPRADWQQWADILAAAGIPHAGTHAMRHSAAAIGLDEGTALAVVQELLGHSDIRVTRGYTHVSSALAADGAERIGRALFGDK